MKKLLQKAVLYYKAHKIIGSIIILIIIIGGYYSIKKITAGPSLPQYTLSPAHIGNLTQTITGSGQVSAENQIDITSDVSGKITSIKVAVGQHVHQGDLLATVDPGDALSSLQSAQIAYEKLTKPALTADITSAQNNITKANTDGYAAIANTFLDLPTIMDGMKSLLYSRDGYLSDQQSTSLSPTGQNYRDKAAATFDIANGAYTGALGAYRLIDKNTPQSTIENMITTTIELNKKIVEALKDAQTAYTFISSTQPDYSSTAGKTAAANLSTWSSTVSSDLSSLISSKSSIDTSRDAFTKLEQGADTLDIQSEQLSLSQAQKNYEKYFIRAPFDGVVGRIPATVYGSAGGSTIIATIVGDQKKAVISLNEVDAAKVTTGQPVTITFDAIDNFTATGTVQEVDQVGTVSQGVVSYGVKILITTDDPRIKPGMSVNTSIITSEKNNVLIVPTSAVKTLGNRKYVQVLDLSNASSTRQRTATSTSARASSFGANGFTISSAITPRQVIITTGDSDDTNIEVLTGLTPGQLVITRTVAASGSSATAAPSILNSLGGNRAGAAGAARGGVGAGAAGAARGGGVRTIGG